MIKVEQKHEYSELTGNPVELAVFFVTWQSFMWATWESVLANKGSNHEILARQLTGGLKMIQNEAMIRIGDEASSRKALEGAIKCCENLGLKIERE